MYFTPCQTDSRSNGVNLCFSLHFGRFLISPYSVHKHFPCCHSAATRLSDEVEIECFFFFFLSSLYSGKTSIPLIWQIEHFRKRGMNIGLIQLRFDILTVIIVCFVFIEVTLIIYSVFFRKSMHSEAPVSAFQSSSCSLSIACCFLYFFFLFLILNLSAILCTKDKYKINIFLVLSDLFAQRAFFDPGERKKEAKRNLTFSFIYSNWAHARYSLFFFKYSLINSFIIHFTKIYDRIFLNGL